MLAGGVTRDSWVAEIPDKLTLPPLGLLMLGTELHQVPSLEPLDRRGII
jgi:hypothetical protein